MLPGLLQCLHEHNSCRHTHTHKKIQVDKPLAQNTTKQINKNLTSHGARQARLQHIHSLSHSQPALQAHFTHVLLTPSRGLLAREENLYVRKEKHQNRLKDNNAPPFALLWRSVASFQEVKGPELSRRQFLYPAPSCLLLSAMCTGEAHVIGVYYKIVQEEKSLERRTLGNTYIVPCSGS